MISESLKALIQSKAAYYSFEPALLSAFVMQETGGNPWLTRFEPNWQYWESPMVWAGKLGITTQTEKVLQATSWGPMQIMGSVAREMGFDIELTQLTDPGMALTYSCMKLGALRSKYLAPDDLISAWNAGTPRKSSDGTYSNQHYVDGVNRYLAQFRANA